jgi:hypothetical protein
VALTQHGDQRQLDLFVLPDDYPLYVFNDSFGYGLHFFHGTLAPGYSSTDDAEGAVSSTLPARAALKL